MTLEEYARMLLQEVKLTGTEMLKNEKNGRVGTAHWWALQNYKKMLYFYFQMGKLGVTLTGDQIFDWSVKEFKKLTPVPTPSPAVSETSLTASPPPDDLAPEPSVFKMRK